MLPFQKGRLATRPHRLFPCLRASSSFSTFGPPPWPSPACLRRPAQCLGGGLIMLPALMPYPNLTGQQQPRANPFRCPTGPHILFCQQSRGFQQRLDVGTAHLLPTILRPLIVSASAVIVLSRASARSSFSRSISFCCSSTLRRNARQS